MSRIIVPLNTLVGRKLLNVTALVIDGSQEVNRLKSIMDQITNAGANKALLETPGGESQMPAGSGAAIYDGLAAIKVAFDSLAATVSAIDQG